MVVGAHFIRGQVWVDGNRMGCFGIGMDGCNGVVWVDVVGYTCDVFALEGFVEIGVGCGLEADFG